MMCSCSCCFLNFLTCFYRLMMFGMTTFNLIIVRLAKSDGFIYYYLLIIKALIISLLFIFKISVSSHEDALTVLTVLCLLPILTYCHSI